MISRRFWRCCRVSSTGKPIRHVLEVRHESFVAPAFIELARKHSVAIVLVDSDKHPLFADVTSDFVYLRLQRTSEKAKTGYPPRALDDLGGAGAGLGRGRRAGRFEDHRRSGAGEAAARRVRLHDLRRQGARARGRDGVDRAAQVRWH